ncbi:DUF3168 domain-containing protein [Paludisphaera sp.]|uniref:tail completion protein gp17 n=1 Tax=Paludisphaera sp. TaxID=2017432 RepID=UPI00301D23B7
MVGIRPLGIPVALGAPPGASIEIEAGPETLRAAVRAMLRDAPAVFELVGERIRFAASKQRDATPRITYTVPSSQAWSDLDGATGTDEARVRVSAWADGSVRAEALAAAVRAALDGFKGQVGRVWVESAAWLQDVDLPEPSRGGRDASIYQIASDFSFIYRLP